MPVVATPVSRVVNSREAPAAGHSGKRAPMCRFLTGCAQPGGVRFRSGSRLWGATASERGAMIHSHCGDWPSLRRYRRTPSSPAHVLRFVETGWVPPSGTLVMPCDTDCMSD